MSSAWDLSRWVRDTRGNHVYNGALPPPFCLRESRHFAHTNVLLPQLPNFDTFLRLISINRPYIYKAYVCFLRNIAVLSRLLILFIVSKTLIVIFIIIVMEFSLFILTRSFLPINFSLIVKVLVIDLGY